MCEYYAYQTTYLLMEIIPTCLELRMSYDWRATALKLSPRRFAFFLLFGSLFRNPKERTETCEKSFCNTSFQVGMGVKKGRNKAKMKECKKTTTTPAVYFCRRRVVLLHSFISCLVSVLFSGPPLYT